MLKPCWNCGQLPRCPKCGSTERRTTSTGCAECHRRNSAERNRPPPDDTDIVLTPALVSYLQAFDAWLLSRDRASLRARERALERLEGPP